MKRTLRILRRAQFDLMEILRYVERDRPDAAKRIAERLLPSIESLGELSERGAVPRDERLAALGYRVLVRGEHLVFYKVLRAQVRVYRVLHGRRKYAHLIGSKLRDV
jgi:plasmid stabilization system protein ParE